MQSLDLFLHVFAEPLVEGSHGLVEEKCDGVEHLAAGQGPALLLPVGKLAWRPNAYDVAHKSTAV